MNNIYIDYIILFYILLKFIKNIVNKIYFIIIDRYNIYIYFNYSYLSFIFKYSKC